MKPVRWPPWEVTSLEQQLDRLTEAVANSDARSDDDQIWLSRFLIVRSCGYLEQVVHETTRGHLFEKTGGTGRTFAMSWLTRSRNPSPDNLIEIVGRLDSGWEMELFELFEADDGHIKRELALLVDRRHKIAHGLSEGISSRKVLDLVLIVKEVADWFIRRLNPTAAARVSQGHR